MADGRFLRSGVSGRAGHTSVADFIITALPHSTQQVVEQVYRTCYVELCQHVTTWYSRIWVCIVGPAKGCSVYFFMETKLPVATLK